MFSIYTILIILGAHYFADFKFQNHWEASNKSKNNIALLSHVNKYTFCMIAAGMCMLGAKGVLWGLLNGVIHFATDYITSRMTAKRWKEERWHDFFEVVGLDQYIHYICLFGTYLLF